MADSRPGDRGVYTSLWPRTTNTEADADAIEHKQCETDGSGRRRRLNWIHLLVLLLGSATLFVVLIILGLLWRESMIAISGTEPRVPWIEVLSANRAASVVTICTAISRTAMVFQASLVTAMLAAIILETIGVPIFQAPFYSIIRTVDVAPNNLLSWTMFHSKGIFGIFIYTLIVVEVLVTIASQFLSTILISDFANGSFANVNSSTDIPTMEGPASNMRIQPWEALPASSWTFAELSEPSIEGSNFDDTGHTYRAFLPFKDEAERTNLRKFHGPAFIMDQRVVCVSPLLTNLSLDVTYGNAVSLSGQVAVDAGSYPMLQETRSQSYIRFTCRLPPVSTTGAEGLSSLCSPKSGLESSALLENPLVDPLEYNNRTAGVGIPIASTMLMIINVMSPEAVADELLGKIDLEAAHNQGPWAIATNESAFEILRLTSCITNLGAQTFTADIHGSHARQEPKLTWDLKAQGFSTEASLRQLGASSAPGTLEDRGVLQLGSRSQWQESTTNTSDDNLWFFSESLAKSMPVKDSDPHPMERQDQDVVLSAGSGHTAMFHDALRFTERPAVAIQALLARIHQMAYYDALPKIATTAAATTSFSTTALLPTRWSGFAAVTAIIGTHFSIVVIVVVLFLRSTSHSLIGNHWQAVSQVISEETLPVLAQADKMQDIEVKSWAKSRSVDLRSHAIIRRQGNGRITLSARDLVPSRSPTPPTTERNSMPDGNEQSDV